MVRYADPARDGAACAAIYAPHVRDGVSSFEEAQPSAAEMAHRIETVSVTYPWLVFERGDSVVGYAHAATHRQRAAYRWAADVSVYVDAAQRRCGIARTLYGVLFELLREQRLRIACAGITLPNQASVALHESLGFARVGVFAGIGWKAGEWRDVGWWQLDLAPRGADAPAEPLRPVRRPLAPQPD